ncbi:fibronectin type III domain-containing protein [Hymenobacter daeguensis]
MLTFTVRLFSRFLLAGSLLMAAQAHAQAPANDDCAGAIVLPVAPVGSGCTPFTASNANATDTPGLADPTCAAYYQGGDVWYTLTVPASGNLQITSSAVAGSPVDDTQLTLYSGSCGTLSEVGCNEDIDWNNYFSRLVASGLTPGQVLYLRASTYGNYTQGQFGLCVQEIPPCGAPTGVAVSGISATKATISFVPNALATGYTITYTPVGGSAQTTTTSGSPQQITGLLPATAYTVDVSSDCGSSQPTSASVSFTTGPAPANDDCAGAIALPVGLACTAPPVVMTEGASASTGVADPSCANYQGSDLWYTVTVPANGIIMLETSESSSNVYNTGLAVYAGTCGSLTPLTCDDNGSGVSYSYVRLTGRTPGEVLYVRAWIAGNYQHDTFALCATTDDALPTTTWTGTSSGNWFDAANWSAGVPTALTNASVLNTGGIAHWPSLSTSATAEVHTLSIDKYTQFSFLSGTLAVSGNLLCREPYASFLNSSDPSAVVGGTVELRGSAPQQVSGLGELYDLRMSSTSTATLTSQLRLDHRLTMDGGVLNTGRVWIELYNDNLFAGEFFSSAQLVHESETSYVVGRIQTNRAVGQGVAEDFSGLGLTLSTSSSNTPGGVRLNRYTGTAQPGVNGRAGILRYYVADLGGPDSGFDLTMDFHYFAHERNGIAAADLRPFSSPLTGSNSYTPGTPTGPWTAEAVSARLAPVAPDSAGTIRLTGLTHLSGWTLSGPAPTPLPVELSSFAVAASGPDAVLRWTTASERNNRYFEAEVSRDGATFTPIGRVAGHGTTQAAQAYSLRHAAIASYGAAQLYYRLHQVDNDGAGSYSPVRTLTVAPAAEGRAEASAFPNPFTQNLAVRVVAPAAGLAQLVLHDLMGREVLRQTTHLPAAGLQDLTVANAAQLPAGLYLLTVALPGQTVQLRVSRQ